MPKNVSYLDLHDVQFTQKLRERINRVVWNITVVILSAYVLPFGWKTSFTTIKTGKIEMLRF
jgi:hypothetical protein